MLNHKLQHHFRKAFAVLSATILITSSAITTFAADSSHKFSDIDLKVSIPEELVCFTRSTTNNNAYLKKLGVSDASELRATMEANHVYLEAVNKDVTYEIAIAGEKASSELPNFDTTDTSRMENLFQEYLESCNIETEDVTEVITGSEIYENNGVRYFVTDASTTSKTQVTVYTKKYYTVMQGMVYTFILQSNTNQIDASMTDNLLHIINSAQYVPVKKSLMESNLVTEVLSNIVTVGIPILILLLVLYLLDHTKKKSAKQISAEEARLREQYAKEEAAKKDSE